MYSGFRVYFSKEEVGATTLKTTLHEEKIVVLLRNNLRIINEEIAGEVRKNEQEG